MANKFISIESAISQAKRILIDYLTDYVRKNGDNMTDYYYNEFGIDEEDEDEVEVIKVLDTSEIGVCFARQFCANKDVENIDRDDFGFEIFDKLEEIFHYATYWAFYIVKKGDNEYLKYYCFYNDGVCYQDDSEPDHGFVEQLTLEDIANILEVLSQSEKK
jgi:hypothetical protein